eukprot:scaffold145311_cov133-Phaeocystis_antarctica.AAC.1
MPHSSTMRRVNSRSRGVTSLVPKRRGEIRVTVRSRGAFLVVSSSIVPASRPATWRCSGVSAPSCSWRRARSSAVTSRATLS